VPRSADADRTPPTSPLPVAVTGPPPSPARSGTYLLGVLLAAATAVALRLAGLRSLQAEVYGDIAIVREYLDLIRRGDWPFHFELSSGPLYHYLVMPVIALAGPGYFGMKLASVAVSLGVLAATFAVGRRLGGDLLGLLALFVAGVSSWLLVFSRLGNSQIVVPLLATTSLWLLVRFVQEQRRRDLVLSATVAALGLYGYPQSFLLAPVLAATLLGLRATGLPVRWKDVGLFVVTSLVVALPFAGIVRRDPANFFTGYIGGKVHSPGGTVRPLLENAGRVVLSLHVRGDRVFRSNPSGRPHLDVVSGVLFLLGVAFWLRPERRRWSPAIFLPFVLQHVPSLLVLRSVGEVPSASRALGAAPEAYILVASGVLLLLDLVARFRGARPVLATLLLGSVLALNVHRYLFEYLPGLPYDNTPIAALVASYVNDLPPATDVYLVGCCWKEGMPEPKGIEFGLDRPERLHRLEPGEVSCGALARLPEPAVLIWDFRAPLPGPHLAPCAGWLPAQLYQSRRGRPVFFAAPLRHDGEEKAPAS
jgi:4-amino-4-deoxy-L-arabinose transferase-like glycosyltransferase